MTAYATIAPLEQVYAVGHMYRQATWRPREPIVFWGMWIIFGPGVFAIPIFLLVMAIGAMLPDEERGWPQLAEEIDVTWPEGVPIVEIDIEGVPMVKIEPLRAAPLGPEPVPLPIWFSVIALVPFVAVYLAQAAILYHMTRNYLRRQPDWPPGEGDEDPPSAMPAA